MRFCLTILVLSFSYKSLFAQSKEEIYIQVLGITQDGGFPHAGCEKQCCKNAWITDSLQRHVVSLAMVDVVGKHWWLFEATPDIKYQLHEFREITGGRFNYLPDGIFITHAHIGHYTGLMQFGREVMNTKELPVYVLPRFKNYLETNGPWSQLVSLKNISLKELNRDSMLMLPDGIRIQSFTLPHRDEYSETAGFKITTPSKKYLFIPDIDKWEKWNTSIVSEVKTVDIAFLDATFYTNIELPNRSISEVPHPLVTETMELFRTENLDTKNRICFIHFNHTNALLWNSELRNEVQKKGFRVAVEGGRY